jgi:hypothetical protein
MKRIACTYIYIYIYCNSIGIFSRKCGYVWESMGRNARESATLIVRCEQENDQETFSDNQETGLCVAARSYMQRVRELDRMIERGAEGWREGVRKTKKRFCLLTLCVLCVSCMGVAAHIFTLHQVDRLSIYLRLIYAKINDFIIGI